MVRLITRVDIKNSFLVKGVHLEGLRTLGPIELFTKFYSEENVDEILLTDCVASLFDRNNLVKYIEIATKELLVPITVSGGIRRLEDINNLLKAGADKVSVNSGVLKNKNFLIDAVKEFGSSTITVGNDAKKNQFGKYECFIDNGRESSDVEVSEWIKEVQDLGAGEIILTSIDKDGTRSGFDKELVHLAEKISSVPLIIGGGAGRPDHLVDILEKFKSVDGFAIASIFHFNLIERKLLSKKIINRDIKNMNLNLGIDADNLNLKNIDTFSIHDVKKHLLKKNFDVRIIND